MPSIDPGKRVAVITGCSEPSSLGSAFAHELLGRGWTVFATARKIATLDHLKEAGAEVLTLDVTSDTSVAEAAKAVSTLTGGRVDLVINNAGAFGRAPVTQTDPAKLAAMHDLHVLGPLRMAQAFYPYLSQTATSALPAKVVNIGSVVSHGLPWTAAYATTKAGVQVLSDVMRREFAPFNIDVITVELALVSTAMSTGSKDMDLFLQGAEPFANASRAIQKSADEFENEGKKAPQPRQVAKVVVDAVEKRRSPPKLWLGRNGFLFHWIVPYLPVSMADALFSKLMNVSAAV